MKDERFRKTAIRIGNIAMLFAFLLSTGCLTTSKRDIPHALYYDNEYFDYVKLDAKQPPQGSVAEHHQKLEQNAKLKETIKNKQEDIRVLETQILPDLKADISYLEGKAECKREIRNAYIDSIAASVQEIRDFNTKGKDLLDLRIEASYIPLGVPPFVRKNSWNPVDEQERAFTLIIDKTHLVTRNFSPTKGELCASGMGKFRFVLVRTQEDGSLLAIPIGKQFEITEKDLKEDGYYFKDIDINVRKDYNLREGDYAGIIVENKMGLFYDTSSSIDSFNTGEVLVIPCKEILDSPEKVEASQQKEAAFSFTLYGLYENEQ